MVHTVRERARWIIAFSSLAKGLAKFGAREVRQSVELVRRVGELAFLAEGAQTENAKLASKRTHPNPMNVYVYLDMRTRRRISEKQPPQIVASLSPPPHPDAKSVFPRH